MSFVTVSRRGGEVLEESGPTQEHIAAEAEAEIARRVREEVAALRRAAEAQGRAEGEAAGMAAAQAQTAAEVGPAIQALHDAVAQLAAPLAQKERDLAEMVTDLAFVLARHIIGIEVRADAESLTQLVTQLIAEAASERGPRQSIVARLHPQDHAVLAPVVAIENARLLADPAISRGGVFVEIIAPDGDPLDRIEWDATIETRLASLRAGLMLRDEAGGIAP